MAKKTNEQTEQTDQVDQVEQLRQDIITNKEEDKAQTPKTKPKMVRAAKPENDPPSFSSVSPEVLPEPLMSPTPIFADSEDDILTINGDILSLKRNKEVTSVIFGMGR